MGFAPNVANPIKYTPTCPDTPLKTGKLQIRIKITQKKQRGRGMFSSV
jgi:hypothetical protein